MKKFSVRIYDPNGDLLKIVDKENPSAAWDYNRQGGCGQCAIRIVTSDDTYVDTVRTASSVKIFIDDEQRYWGKVINVSRRITSNLETVDILAFGFATELQKIIVTKTYRGQGIKPIVEDILNTFVAPVSGITFSADDIDDPNYSVELLELNHTVQDAMVLLAGLAGDIEWGVDFNKQFFFRLTETEIKHVFIYGRDVVDYNEDRNDEGIINVINVYGDDGFIVQMQSRMSVKAYGWNEANFFESSITTLTDAVRLASAFLAQTSTFKRAVKFKFVRDDHFIESVTPIGSISVNANKIRVNEKYGRNNLYGRNKKYGKLKRDQLKTIKYQIRGGGLTITANLQDDVANLGDLSKRADFEIKDLQRRT